MYARAPCLASLFSSCLAWLFVRLEGLFILLAGFCVFGNEIYRTIEDEIVFPPHIILEAGKQQDLRNELYQMVEDALNIGRQKKHGIES